MTKKKVIIKPNGKYDIKKKSKPWKKKKNKDMFVNVTNVDLIDAFKNRGKM